MAKFLYLRVAGAAVLCATVFLLVSLDTFLSAAPFSPGVGAHTPAVHVNRFRKGDRLPLYRPDTVGRNLRRSGGLQAQRHVPFGCDHAFSPVATPALSTVFGRCMA
jgi:hypothetical protein